MEAMKGLLKSRFLATLLIFSLVSGLLAFSQAFRLAADDYPYQSWTSWTISDFLRRKERANVVFLGSSLMLVPLAGVDADFLGKRLDGSKHHISAYFQHKLKQETGLDIKAFSFALPGEMPSDAYLILRNLLSGARKPDVIIYGVGPRDFLDNTLSSPASTDPFRFLSKFGEFGSIASSYMTDFMLQLDYGLGELFYPYGARADISRVLSETTEAAINRLLPLPSGVIAMNSDEKRRLIAAYRPYEVLEGQSWFRPSTAEDHKIVLNNLDEYKKRYGKMNWNTYICQMQFLASLLNLSKERGIHVVLMTMPITDANRCLISSLSWQAYHDGVLGMARRKGATVVDLNRDSDFSNADFMDTVHLHSGGGKHLLDKLWVHLSSQKSFLSALKYGSENQKRIARNKGAEL